MVPIALTIAGSDSSGGAGIQADLKTFAAMRVYGASVLTALTAQNTRGVRAIADLDPSFVAAQIDAVAEDLRIDAVKTGMLSNAAVVETVARCLRSHRLPNLVVDPVIVATSGDILLRPDAIDSVKKLLFPIATLVTPNLREAEVLLDRPVNDGASMREAARAIAALGARAVLVKGGHLSGDAVDVLFDGREFREFRSARVPIARVHGAGCTLSAAITACLAHRYVLGDAIAAAKRYVTRAIETAPSIGQGARPLNHLVENEPTTRRAPRSGRT